MRMADRLPITLSPIQPYHRLGFSSASGMRRIKARIDAALASGNAPGSLFARHLVAVDFEAGARSARQQIQGWAPISQLCLLGTDRYLRIARHFAVQWLDAEETRPPEDAKRPVGAGIHLEGPGHFAWYDAAVATRGSRLAYLLDRLARAPSPDTALIDRMAAMLARHLDYLADETNIARQSNHGMLQALGYLSIVRRFPETDWIAAHGPRARALFADMLARQFGPDAIHREHSPGYHSIMLFLLRSALDTGVLGHGDFPEGFLAAAEKALSWMVTPDGHLLGFGDTDPVRAGAGLANASWETPDFARSMLHDWRERRDRLGARFYEQTGLAIVRDASEPEGPRSYLAVNGANHSRVHRHADDLSLVWFEGEDAILADPGRYGYAGRTDPTSEAFKLGFWYDDPRRMYVESTAAHNCIEIDRQSHARRGASHYGSAITRVESADGAHLVSGDARYASGVRHVRTIVLRSGRWLILLDWVDDRGGLAHDIAQWLKFGPNVAVSVAGGPSLDGGRSAFVSQFIDSGAPSMARGQVAPIMRGWLSPKRSELIPAPSLRFEHHGARARIGTIIAIDEDARVVASRLNSTLTAGWIDVEARGTVERVEIALGGHGEDRPPLRIGPRG